MKKLMLLLSLLVASVNTNASIVTYTDKAAWSAVTGSTLLYDFNSDSNGSFMVRDFGDFKAELKNQSGTYKPSVIGGELQLQVSNYVSELELIFDSSLSSLGFDWRNTDPSRDKIELNILGETFVFGPGQSSGFFGLTSTILFDSIGLSDTVGNGGALTTGYIDNLRYSNSMSSVPVPAALFLFAPALLGFLGLRRKVNT